MKITSIFYTFLDKKSLDQIATILNYCQIQNLNINLYQVYLFKTPLHEEKFGKFLWSCNKTVRFYVLKID